MTLSKQRLRALGLCLVAALGLAAFVASAAQAQTGWLINKAFITANKGIGGEIHPLTDGKKHIVLLISFGVSNTLELLCETLETKEGSLFAGEKAEGLIVLNFTKCKSLLNKVESAPCKPKEPIVWKAKFHVILHTTGDKKTYLLFEPDEKGKPFTTINFGEECAIGPSVAITGDFVEEGLNEKLEKNISTTDYLLEDLINHLIQEVATKKLFPLEEKVGFFDELLFGTKPVALDGIIKLFLTAPETGKTWAVHI